MSRSSLAPYYTTTLHTHIETGARELRDRSINRYTETWTKQERAWRKVSEEVGLCVAQRRPAHSSQNGSNNLPQCQHPLPFTSVVGHFRCGFCICVVAFVFVLWLLYLYCGFCICVMAFVFVLWLLYLRCGFCIWPDTSGPPYPSKMNVIILYGCNILILYQYDKILYVILDFGYCCIIIWMLSFLVLKATLLDVIFWTDQTVLLVLILVFTHVVIISTLMVITDHDTWFCYLLLALMCFENITI